MDYKAKKAALDINPDDPDWKGRMPSSFDFSERVRKPSDPDYWQWRKNKMVVSTNVFDCPQTLWELACDFFEQCDQNPLITEDFIKGGDKGGQKVKLEKARVYTWEGLDEYCRSRGFPSLTDIRHDLRNHKAYTYTSFTPMLALIESIIRRQKFEGVVAGIFNAPVLIRDLGLTEKSEVNVVVEQPIFQLDALNNPALEAHPRPEPDYVDVQELSLDEEIDELLGNGSERG